MEARDIPDMLGKHDPVDDWITFFLVAVTLLGAVIAWRQADAHFDHDEATVQAEQWSVLASSQQGRANQVALLAAGRRRQIRRDRIGAQQAAAAVALGAGDRSLSAIEEGQWERRAEVAQSRSGLLAEQEAKELGQIEADATAAFPDVEPLSARKAACEAGPGPPAEASIAIDVVRPAPGKSTDVVGSGQGPSSPLAVYSPAREAYRMEGLRDAAEETAAQAEEQFTTYAVALAFVAVALFLFGYALTKYGFKFRRRFVFVGLLLTVGAVVAGGIALFNSPHKAPAAAAAAYADGQIALEHGELKIALVDFRCANQLNPDFAAAFLGRSLAVDQRGQRRDTSVINLGTQSPVNLRKALKYARRARRDDSDDPRVLGQIATALYIQGVDQDDRGDLGRAVALDEQIEEELPRDPIAVFNAGAGRLALGLGWRERYRRAGLLLKDASQPLEYIGGALTDLDTLQQSHLWPGIALAAGEAKEEVISVATSALPPAADTGEQARASLRNVRLLVTPTTAGVSFTARRLHPREVFVAIYRDEGPVWQELQQLSGSVRLGPPVKGRYETALAYDSPTSCLGSGAYKVELYVNGQLANAGGIVGQTVHLPQLKRSILPGINVRLCAPKATGWHKILRRSPGVVDGFERPGPRREGIVVADLSAAVVHGGPALAALALNRLAPLPSVGRQVGPGVPVAFEGPTKATRRIYRYRGGELVMAIGTTPIGRRLAIAVFGPPSFFAPGPGRSLSMADSLFGSVSPQDISPFVSAASSGN